MSFLPSIEKSLEDLPVRSIEVLDAYHLKIVCMAIAEYLLELVVAGQVFVQCLVKDRGRDSL